MDRLSFLKSLLAVVGLGQNVKGPTTSGDLLFTDAKPTCWGMDGQRTGCELKPGEERCPLLHAQIPERITISRMVLEDVLVLSSASGTWTPEKRLYPDGSFEQHVCSVCKIVYAPNGDLVS